MRKLEFSAFTFRLSKLGYFKRREGNIYWLGIEDNDTLFKINRQIHQSLLDKGFMLEDKEYKPHITIGRKVILKDSFNTKDLDDIVKKIEIDINNVDLMKSEFVNGKLIHSVVFSKPLPHKN